MTQTLFQAFESQGRKGYHESLKKALDECTLDDCSHVLGDFYQVESQAKICEQASYQKFYAQIFTKICNRIFLELVVNNRFNFDLFKVAALLDKWPGNLPPDARLNSLREQMLQAFETNSDTKYRFVVCGMLFVLESFQNNKSSQQEFIKRLITLNPYEVFVGEGDFEIFSEAFSSYFEDIHTFIKLLSTHVYDSEGFSQKPFEEKRLAFVWAYAAFLPAFEGRTEWIELYPQWKCLFEDTLKHQDTELACFLYFFLSHLFLNRSQTQQQFAQFNREIEQPLATFFAQQAKELDLQKQSRGLQAGQKLKIGICTDRIVFNSPYKLLYSLCKAFGEYGEGAEVFVYDYETIEKCRSDNALVLEIQKQGIPYASAHDLISDGNKSFFYNQVQKLTKFRDKIIEDGIDVLISGDSGLYTNFLFSTRSAPLQLFWSHGNYVYDIPGIDERILHGGHEDKVVEYEGYSFERFHQFVDKEFYTPEVDLAEAQAVRARFGEGKVILGSIGRMVKFDSEPFICTLAKILKANPNTVFLICGGGPDEGVKDKLRKYEIVDQVFLEGHVDPHLYAYVFDLFLDTFPLNNGESLWEYVAKARPAVFLHRRMLENSDADLMTALDNINEIGAGQRVYRGPNRQLVFCEDDYVTVTNHIIQNTLGDTQKTQELILNPKMHVFIGENRFDLKKGIQSFLSVIQKIVTSSK